MQIDSAVQPWRISQLRAHPDNDVYNSQMTAKEETALKASIAEHGIQEALLVRPDGTILSGHQRARIATALGLVEAPVRTVECTDPEAVYLLVATNEARRSEEKDLIKKARRVQVLYQNWGIKPGRKSVQDAHFDRHDVAKTLNLDDSSIRRLLKLLYLIPELQQEVSNQTIGLIAGNKIAALDRDNQYKFLAAYREAGGAMTIAAIGKIIAQLQQDVSPELQELRRDRQKRTVTGKVERIKKDLTWLMTVSVDATEREELVSTLKAYAGYLSEKEEY